MVVFRNEWKDLSAQAGAAVRDGLSDMTVVVPSRGGTQLALCLAALAAVEHPMKVLVVDDGAGFSLPELRPSGTVLLRQTSGWGKSAALNRGVEASDAPFIFMLDDDMVVAPNHFELQMSWLLADPDVVTLGGKLIVPTWSLSPDQVYESCRRGAFRDLCSGGLRHHHLEEELAATEDFHRASLDAFRVFVGATIGMRRRMFVDAGGYDERVVTGEDTEFGYRLGANGAVLVPVRGARAWHLGLTAMMRSPEPYIAHNSALLAGRVPSLPNLRRGSNTIHAVDDVVVCAHVDAPTRLGAQSRASSGDLQRNIEFLLGRELGIQARLHLVADWPSDSTRYSVVGDGDAEIRSLARFYGHDPRVELATSCSEDVFPAPMRIEGPLVCLTPNVVLALLEAARRQPEGVVALGVDVGGVRDTVSLVRTAAARRALRTGVGPEDVWGQLWLTDEDVPELASSAVQNSSAVLQSRTPFSADVRRGLYLLKATRLAPVEVARLARRVRRAIAKRLNGVVRP